MKNTYKEKWLLESFVVLFIQVYLKMNKETNNSWNVFSILLALTDMPQVRFSNPDFSKPDFSNPLSFTVENSSEFWHDNMIQWHNNKVLITMHFVAC